MNCEGFHATLLRWIDGELPGDEGRAAAEHESACTDCAASAAGERAFEARTRSALVSGTPDIDVGALLRDARARTGETRLGGRLLRLRRMVSSIAGVAAVFLGLAWFNCVPPFECSYLQAVERAAYEESGAPLADEAPEKGYPPVELLGHVREGDVERVHVAYRQDAPAVRARYAAAGGPVVVMWCEQIGHRPSFRRREDRDGAEWWVMEENGRTLVSYLCPVTNSLVTVAGESSEAELFAIAGELRKAH